MASNMRGSGQSWNLQLVHRFDTLNHHDASRARRSTDHKREYAQRVRVAARDNCKRRIDLDDVGFEPQRSTTTEAIQCNATTEGACL